MGGAYANPKVYFFPAPIVHICTYAFGLSHDPTTEQKG